MKHLPTNLHLRLDGVTEEEIVQTVLFDGEERGTLRLSHGEYQLFGAALGIGSETMRTHLTVTSDEPSFDDDGEFCMPEKMIKPLSLDGLKKRIEEGRR